jgi:hypothetical protein
MVGLFYELEEEIRKKEKKDPPHIHKGEEATFFFFVLPFFLCWRAKHPNYCITQKNYYIKHKKEERKKKPKEKGAFSLCECESFPFFSFPLSHK